MPKQTRDSTATCSFCGKERDGQRRLIAGPGVAICTECVTMCADILLQEKKGVAGPTDSAPVEGALGDLPTEVLLKGLQYRSSGIDRSQHEVQEAVSILRLRGTSWASIGEALGVSRQSAWERYSREE